MPGQPLLFHRGSKPRGMGLAMHAHDEAQLTFAASGTVQVHTGQGRWLVPPQLAVWIPAGVWLVLWFVGQIMNSLGSPVGVAWYAHIGGFVAGMILGPVFMGARRRRVPARLR